MSRAKRIVIFCVVLAICFLATLPLLLDEEVQRLDSEVRKSAVGEFLEGPEGLIHYQIGGPEDGPPVLLIHGVSGPLSVWDQTWPALTEQGFRVIRFDLYGRGYSDRPDSVYDLSLYHRQIDSLLDQLVGERPVILVGSSMGCIIAAGLAQEEPERFPLVALIGPAGFPLKATPVASLMKVPYLNEYLMKVVGGKNLRAHNRKYFFRPDEFESYHQAYIEQMQYEGYKRSILSTLNNVPVKDFESGYAALDRSGVPVLLIWGEEDRTFPFEFHRTALELMPKADFLAVSEAGHLPMYERPDVVHETLLDFLKRNLEPKAPKAKSG